MARATRLVVLLAACRQVQAASPYPVPVAPLQVSALPQAVAPPQAGSPLEVIPPGVGAQPAAGAVSLECAKIELSAVQVTLPAFDVTATLTLRNSSPTPIAITQAGLSFLVEDKAAANGWRDVTGQIYVEPDGNNPQLVPPQQTGALKFRLQFFHDTPPRKLHLRPDIHWQLKPNDAFGIAAVHIAPAPEHGAQPLIVTAKEPPVQRLQSVTGADPVLQILPASSSALPAGQRAAPAPIVFLGDDHPAPGTGGDWIGRYGNASFILCGMDSPQDIVGGRYLPRQRWQQGRDGYAPTTPVWSDWTGEFPYEAWTGEGKPIRHWIPPDAITTQDPRALLNPLEGGRRFPSWDDEGEMRGYNTPGPDLVIHLEIPAGLWRLTLYFIDWDHFKDEKPRQMRYFFYDVTGQLDASNKTNAQGIERNRLVSSGYVSDLKEGVYKVFAAHGPSKLRLRIQKHRSINAVISAIFLDEMRLPDVQRAGLPPLAQQSARLRQATQHYAALRQLSQQAPEAFLQGGARMQEVFADTNQLLAANAPPGAPAKPPLDAATERVAQWLRWQCASTLVVAPDARAAAFTRYIALQPSPNAEAARQRVQGLLEIGEIGLARLAVEPWLQLAHKESAATESAALREGILWFSKRDPDFAGTLAQRLAAAAKAQNLGPQPVLDTAAQMTEAARLDWEGTLHSRTAYRVVAALYEATAKTFGPQGLGDAGAFQLADATAHFAGYRHSAEKQAISYYQKYLQQWPQGKYVTQAHLQIIDLVGQITYGSSETTRSYVALADASARWLLAQSEGKPAAERQQSLNAAYRLARMWAHIGEKKAANQWYEEVMHRVPFNDPLVTLITKELKS